MVDALVSTGSDEPDTNVPADESVTEPVVDLPSEEDLSPLCGIESEFGICIRVRNHGPRHDFAIVEQRATPYPYDERRL